MKTRRTTGKAGLTALLAATLVLASCGSTRFSGSTGKPKPDGSEKPDEGGDGRRKDPPPPKKPQPPGPVTDEFRAKRAEQSYSVDIAFLMDTSGSMDEEQSRLEQHMQVFLDRFLKQNKLDFQLLLVGEDFQFPAGVTSEPNVEVVSHEIGSHDALDAASRLLSGGLPDQKTTLRPSVPKEIVVVTDDNARGSGITAVRNMIQATTGDPVRINGLVGLKTGRNNSWCNIENVGSAYLNLSLQSEAPGLVQDLCIEDWSKLLGKLGKTIVEAGPLTFELSKTPKAETVKVQVNGSALEKKHYEINGKEITLLRGAEVGDGSKVTVSYKPQEN